MALDPPQQTRPLDSVAAARPALTPAQLVALAEKVYQLILADLRLERARGASTMRKER